MRTKTMDRTKRHTVLVAWAALLWIPACGTEEVGPSARAVVNTMPGPDQGALVVTFAPSQPTIDAEQAWAANDRNPTPYTAVVDGAQLAYSVGGPPDPFIIFQANEVGLGYLPAGQHHLALAAAGAAPVFDADVEIVAGAQNELYLYWPGGAVRSRFVSYPSQPAPGMLHVSAVNLVQGGATVEVVSCLGDAACTSLSPALALGDAFEADFAATALDGTAPYYTLASGATLGLREVPTAQLATPPVVQLMPGTVFLTTPADPSTPPANMVIAPVYIRPDGTFAMWTE